MKVSRIVWMFLLAGVCFAQKRDAEFASLADRFFDEVVFKYDPVQGTQAGFHQYDAMLGSGSRADIDAQTAALHKFEQEVESFGAGGLSAGVAADRELVLAQIRGQLLTLEVIRPWEKNPDIYSSGVSSAVFVIMSRKFAPADVRLKSVIAREKLVARLFQSARENLKNPPKIYTEIALEQLPGIVSFFQNDVPAAFKDVRDAPLLEDFRKTNQGVIDSLNAYQAFLKTDLLPRSNGDFRIGAETYRKKLLFDEMVDIPLDRLLEIGRENLRRNQEEFKRVAAQLDKTRSAEQILNESMLDHPAAGKLLQSFRDVLSGLREFIEKNHIVTIPSKVPPIVEETPPFMRALDHRVDGHSGPLREGRQGSILQRHASREDVGRQADRRLSSGLQSRHHHQHRGARSLPRPLHAVCLDRARAHQGPEAARLQLQRRRLGPLHGTDDAGRRLWQGRSETAARAVAGRAVAECALHRGNTDAHRKDDDGGSAGILRQGRLPGPPRGGKGGQTRYQRPDLSRLHAG